MGFFEVPALALRRARLADELPVETLPVFEQLSELVLGLPDPADLTAEQRLGAVRAAARLQTMLEAYQTQVAGVCDTAQDSRVFAAGTTGSMVAALTGQNRAVGSAIVGRARDLRDMPHVADAYRAGEITGRHVQLLCRAAGSLPRFAVLEADLVAAAAVIEPAVLAQVIDVLITQDRPDAPDEDLRAARAKRGLHISDLGNGLYRVDGHLDQVAGARLRDALASFTDPPAVGDDRTPSQRLADALDDLVSAAQANTKPLGVSGVTVLVDAEQLPEGHGARLEDGTLLGPDSFGLLACSAVVSVILGVRRAGTFVPLALGRTQRRASHAQWAALTARDRGCVRCGRAARGCHAHHIVAWAAGGRTDVDAMCLLCPRCHGDLHNGRFTIEMVGGIPRCVAVRRRT
ncbi:MAG: DUF222 domain-containing protein [Candidatus Nanopelagicales bacterium]